ncbi:unnamed protein product, partial [marine sediment metagenome]
GNGEHTGGERFHVIRVDNKIEAELIGSTNPFRKDNSTLKCPFVATIQDQTHAEIKINKDSYALKKDEYTDWIKIDFKAAPGIKVHGICKFLLLSTEPEFSLYVTPINI